MTAAKLRLMRWRWILFTLVASVDSAAAQRSTPPLSDGSTPGQLRTDNALKLALRWCPPGSFNMGSPDREVGRDAYEVLHPVRLTQGFWMGETEVTQGQWSAIMNTSLRDQATLMLEDETLYPDGGLDKTLRAAHGAERGTKSLAKVCAAQAPNIPIYYVSWEDAAEFCARFTERERKAGRLPPGMSYALPTEAQWEYACRAGTNTATYEGNMFVLGENNAPVLNDIAWYGGNSSLNYRGEGWATHNWPNQAFKGKIAGPRRVGQLKANAWGLKDTLGNMYEWVADWSAVPTADRAVDPTGPAVGTAKVYRGGAWNHYATMCRAAKSFEAVPTYRRFNLSFRVALVREPR
jgi:formylglycine-generating enzyme required for sulfatase activity